MDVHPLIFFCLCLVTVIHATKEDVSYGSSQSDDTKHFIELIKRIGKEYGVDLGDINRDDEARAKCKTTKFTSNSIIKSTESMAKGAKYVRSHQNVPSLTECSDLCCDHSDCDTAIYQHNVSWSYGNLQRISKVGADFQIKTLGHQGLVYFLGLVRSHFGNPIFA